VLSKSNSQFFAGIMGSIGIRMLLCVVFLAIYLMVSDLKSNEFVVYYLILYLFYTIFEIYQLVSKLRHEKETKVDNATP
jgi:amino acid permease